jgi:hypothetical protein
MEAEEMLVTANLAIVAIEKADDVALLALWDMIMIVDVAEFCADLIPLVADMDACWSC